MKHPRNYRCLSALSLLCCLPVFAATVYKSIDDNGVVSFSDTPPAADVVVETVIIDEQAPPSSATTTQRLEEMRETTDRMVADRMAREKHRAELRQLNAQASAQSAAQLPDSYYDTPEIYTGYTGYPSYPVRPGWRHPKHPHHPARPPLRPPGGHQQPDFDYPASLIRRHYDPKVRAAFR